MSYFSLVLMTVFSTLIGGSCYFALSSRVFKPSASAMCANFLSPAANLLLLDLVAAGTCNCKPL